MRRRGSALRWILVAAAAVAVAAFVNVVLLRAAQEQDDRVGRLRPLLVGVTEPAATEPSAGPQKGNTSPATTVDSTPTSPSPAVTDDRGSGQEPGDDSGGHGGGSNNSGHGGDDD
jgi:hypothetical protein